MNTHELVRIRADVSELGEHVAGTADPELIEHVAIAGIALLHAHERLEELHDARDLDLELPDTLLQEAIG